jgi:tellurite resistance protein TerC
MSPLHSWLLLAALLVGAGVVTALITRRRLGRMLDGMFAASGDLVLRILRLARRAVILIVGGSVVLVGVVLIFIPGPALVVIPAGLAILAIEFTWARHWLKKIRAKALELQRQAFSGNDKREGEDRSGDSRQG